MNRSIDDIIGQALARSTSLHVGREVEVKAYLRPDSRCIAICLVTEITEEELESVIIDGNKRLKGIFDAVATIFSGLKNPFSNFFEVITVSELLDKILEKQPKFKNKK